MYLLRSLFKDPQGDMSKSRNTGKLGVDNVLYSVSEESDNQFGIKTRESCEHSVIPMYFISYDAKMHVA